MGWVDMTSHEYLAFVEKSDQYTNMSVNGIPNGKYRMSNVEATQTKFVDNITMMQKQIKDLEAKITTVTAVLQQMTEVLRVTTEHIEKLSDAYDIPRPVLQLVDDEFIAAATDPEKYEREQNANK